MKKSTYKYFLIIVGSFFIISCEDVIEVELNDAESMPVIEAKLYNQFQQPTVLLSMSSDFFGELEFNLIEDADVRITDEQGNSTVFAADDSIGIYTAEDFFGVPGESYTLEVGLGESSYTGISYMPEPLSIDSLTDFPFDGEFGPHREGYGLYCFFSNPGGQRDYMKFNIYKNFELSNSLYLVDDFYIDGIQSQVFFRENSFEPGDTVIVEMLTMDAAVYEYLYNLSDIVEGASTGTSIPYNPDSNLSEGALGYFGAFGVNGAVIIIGDTTLASSFSPRETSGLLKRIRR
ncbi:MAG: DUF4249 family protein [Bacteroidota bacterium]|nr:DUF4249 family protein [Bacteroidota bacterium]